MTLAELRYLVALAEHRHFGRAAAACHVTQPTLSIAIRKLEDELGVALVERTSRGIRMTPLGVDVAAQALRVLEEAAQLRRMASASGDPLVGPLRLGAIYTIGPYLLPDVVADVHERAPRMPLVLEEGFTEVLGERLQRGRLDAVLLALPYEAPGVVTMPLYREPFVVLLPASHPLAARERIRAADLAAERVLLPGRGHCLRDQILAACPGCAGSELAEAAAEGSSIETIRHMVASGLGVTVLPCTAAGSGRYSQRLLVTRRFAAPVPSRVVALAWRVSFTRPPAIDVLRDAVAAAPLSCVDMLVKVATRTRARAGSR